jgi:hypothetical protein
MTRFWWMIFLLVLSKLLNGQCDLELLEADLIEGEITVAFNNTENCGGIASPTGIAEIQFGFQALDADCNAMNQGWDFPWGLSIPDDSNHPGWIYSATTTTSSTNWTNLDVWEDYNVDPPYYTGDTVTFPLDDFYQAGSTSLFSNLLNAFDFWFDQGLSIQVVIWQISYGPTMYAGDGGWAETGPIGNGIAPDCCGLYEDDNFLDNWLVVGPCGTPLPEVIVDTVYVELPPDTIYVLEIDTVVEYDTIPVPINWYFYDTTYIYLTDTLYLTEYDTSYITLIDTVYFTDYQLDTLETYEYTLLDVDCDTGLPCTPLEQDCPVYIPNSFTPNNDGVNDVWGAETDTFCWDSWLLTVYSRSGEQVWMGTEPDDIWLGGDEYFVPDGVYAYKLVCSSLGDTIIINGHVTIFR